MKLKALSAAVLAALSMNAISATSVEFIGMSAPATTQEKADAYTGAKIKYTSQNGKTATYDLVYHQLMATGELISDKVVGGLFDSKDSPLNDNDGQMASDAPDGTSLMKIKGMSSMSPNVSNPLALVTNYEYKEIAPNDGVSKGSFWSKIPALISLAKLDQNRQTGALTVTDYDPISFKDVNGGWIHCGGTLSAWNTHISSEEYEPDAKVREGLGKATDSDDATDINSFSKYYFGDEKVANPYHYGLVPEVTVNADGTTKVVKHYATGRFAREMQETAFDNRTTIAGDDGKATGLFMFVANKAKDLSAGSIYAAKIKQTNADNGGAYDVQWIKLGSANNAEIKKFVDNGIKFSDIFEVSNTDPSDNSFTKVLSYTGTEWLKLKTSNSLEMKTTDIAKAAAFLETRRYAALLGATTEFTKMEYIAFNKEDKKFYLTISRIEATMTDQQGDIQKLARNDGGMVLEMQTATKQKDTNGKTINSNYVGTKLVAIPQLVGNWKSEKDAEGNQCTQDNICGPDNLRYVSSIRTLFVGEDTSRRNNNYVWAFNIDTKKLSRILSVPMGAEATGLSVFPNYNGFAYITGNFQHPAEDNLPKYTGTDKVEVLSAINSKWHNKKKAAIGYIGLKEGGLPRF